MLTTTSAEFVKNRSKWSKLNIRLGLKMS